MIEFALNESTSGIPFFEQYLGLWAMHEPQFRGLAEQASGMDVRLHLETTAQEIQAATRNGQNKDLDVRDGTAIVALHGTLMKHVSSFSRGTSTVMARQELGRAVRDPNVSSIMLHIDSPGGTVSGTDDLAEAVAKANTKKPVFAFVEDLGASAAFWVASQAEKVFSNKTAMVGSIGTFGVVHDVSAMAAREGIKVHVIKAGEFKGVGVPGTEITADQLAEEQRVVNALNDEFIRGVARGRRMSIDDVRDIADGRVHVGSAAAKLGLTDGVKTFDQALRLLSSETRTRSTNMSTPATYQELRDACIGADSEFIVDQMERQNTLSQAIQDWMTEQGLRLEEAEKAQRAAQEEADKAAAQPATGVTGLDDPGRGRESSADDEFEYGSATAEFRAAVQKKIDMGMTPAKASSAVVKQRPELHAALLEENTIERKRR